MFNDNIESIFVEIDKSDFSLDRNVVIGVLYRPPNTDIVSFNDYLGNILANVERERKICYIMGDYNINLLNHNSQPKTTSFLDTINRPTRVSENSHTIIDNIIIKKIAELKCSMQGIMLIDISDHFPAFTVNWSIQEKTVDILENRRIMSENSYNRFKQYISNCDWQEILTHQDTNIAFEAFHMKLKSAYDKAFPKKKITKT